MCEPKERLVMGFEDPHHAEQRIARGEDCTCVETRFWANLLQFSNDGLNLAAIGERTYFTQIQKDIETTRTLRIQCQCLEMTDDVGEAKLSDAFGPNGSRIRIDYILDRHAPILPPTLGSWQRREHRFEV